MQRRTQVPMNLNYLKNKPKRINWKVIAGPPDYCLDYLQTYDLIFDDVDLRIRRLKIA